MLSLGDEILKDTLSLTHLDLRYNVLETIREETVRPVWQNLLALQMHFRAEGEAIFSF